MNVSELIVELLKMPADQPIKLVVSAFDLYDAATDEHYCLLDDDHFADVQDIDGVVVIRAVSLLE